MERGIFRNIIANLLQMKNKTAELYHKLEHADKFDNMKESGAKKPLTPAQQMIIDMIKEKESRKIIPHQWTEYSEIYGDYNDSHGDYYDAE
jgi:hypothetical protein